MRAFVSVLLCLLGLVPATAEAQCQLLRLTRAGRTSELVAVGSRASELAKLTLVVESASALQPATRTAAQRVELDIVVAVTRDVQLAEVNAVVSATFRNATANAGRLSTGAAHLHLEIPHSVEFTQYHGTSIASLAGREVSAVEAADLWTRLHLAESVLGRTLSVGEAGVLIRAHDLPLTDIAGKRRLLGTVFTPEESGDFIRLGLAGRSRRSFDVPESPDEARRIVAAIEKPDAFPSITPPGVFASRTGSGEFSAIAPVGLANAKLSVESNGRGGSTVTENFQSLSPFPGGSTVIDFVHGRFTNPETAYKKARSRLSGQ